MGARTSGDAKMSRDASMLGDAKTSGDAKMLRLTTALGLCLGLSFALSSAVAPAAHAEATADAAGASQEAEQAETDTIGDAGAYLAARTAEVEGDFRSAAQWFAQAHAADPSNLQILDGATFALLNLGEIAGAAEYAAKEKSLSAEAGESQLADYALLAHEALTENYAAIVAAAADARKIGPLLDTLALGWAELGDGKMTEALAHFDEVARLRGFEAYGLYHKALALALAGDFEGADKILSGKETGALTLNRRGVIAHAQILSQLERGPEALALLDKAFGTEPEPIADDLRAKLQAGTTLTFDAVRTPRDGIAEVFFSVATLLSGEADPAFTLMNARIAAALRPDHTEALLLTANMLENIGQFDLAVEVLGAFKPDNPAFYSAEISRADALYQAGRKDAAIEAMQTLARGYPNLIQVQSALGDMLRREERWAEALPAYDAAIDLLTGDEPGAWVLYFSRAICYERQKDFDAADVDFRKALEINPKQPQVLNYLGYSLVERGKNLDEALTMIEAAVKVQPDAGYILDSQAWAYFQLGRYADALVPMEKASLLEPVDPVVTDHLGDVYWMNGRKREAEFQWHRALSFGPEEKDAVRIRRKLEIGLDALRAEEAK